MNLFLKIFLWFLAAIVLMVGMMLFLNWTVQTEPVVSRWRVSVRNQTNIYAETAAQIYQAQGEAGLSEFLDRLRTAETVTEVDLIGPGGRAWLSKGVDISAYQEVIDRALASGDVEIISSRGETALTTRSFALDNGEKYVLIVRWDRPRMTPFFGESPLRYVRYAVLLLTGLLLCWALARYLSSPIGKIRTATQKLASGDLKTRLADQVGNRRDELADPARDFDVMAERIESLITSQQRLSRDISHELRSPLARMNVALEIAKQKTNGDTAPILGRIETESARLNEMISRLLTLSRLETGAHDFDRQVIDLNNLVADIAADAEFEANALGKSVKLVTHGTCRIKANENLIASAIENVLRNAVRYTKEGTEVRVDVLSKGGKAVVTIEDQGDGVPDAELTNLFKPSYRVSESRERKTGGMGIGLAIADQAVRAHNGTISAENIAGGLRVTMKMDCVESPNSSN